MTTKSLVLVTGARGTVGQYVVHGLLRQGYRVRSTDICRVHGDFAGINHSFEGGDLCVPSFVEKITTGVDAVINLAADIDVGKSRDELWGINHDAVRSLYQYAAKAGANIFVHASSGSIYAQTSEIRSENARLKTEAEASPYEWSKIQSEEILRGDQAAMITNGQHAPAFVIIRPALIYGPRNKYLAANYLSIAVILHELMGNHALLLKGGPKTNMVHAEDVARATIFCMENPHTWGQAYNAADNSPWGFGDQVTAMMQGFGYKTDGPMIPIPGASILGLAAPIYERRAVLGVLNKVLGFEWKRIAKAHGLNPPFGPKIDPEMTGFFGNNCIFGNSKLKDAGFKLKYPNFADGMRDVARWYMDNGWAPKP